MVLGSNPNLVKISQKTTMKIAIKDIFLKLMLIILKKIHDLYNDLPFLPKKTKTEKVGKLLLNLHDKKEYVKHIRNLKETLNQKISTKQM